MAPLAKVARPSPAGLVPRARLFRLLDRQRETPVTWIAGPAGSGKTSLVASYIAARRLPALWYRLDEGDADLATLFYYLGRAAQAARRKLQPLPLLTPEYAPASPAFALRYFEKLFSRLPPSSVIVLDNYQDVSVRSALHGILARVLAAVPRGFKVVVASRHAPPPAFARLRAHGSMQVVGWDELRLSLDESRRIARARVARGLSRATIEAAHARAAGWAAGLVMIVEGSRGGGALPSPPAHASSGQIFDYFASEVFWRADPQTQDLLLRTAFLPEVTIALAERLTDSRQAARILTALGRSQYFTSSTSDREPVFQYHPLFREFLTARARQTLSAEALAALLQRAGTLLEEAGQAEAAAALLTEAQAWQALAALVLRQAPALAAQGRFQTLAGWIRALPEAPRQENAWLLYWLGVSVLPSGDIETSRQLLQQAFRSFEAHGDDGGCLLAWAAVVETILYAWDDFSLLDSWIRWLEERSSTGTPFPTPQIEAAVTIAMTGALVFRLPAQVDPRPWTARARALLREAPDLHARLRAGSYLGLYGFWMGHFPVVREIVDEIRRISRAPHAPPLSAITWQWFEGAVLTFDAMEPEACLSLTDATLQLAERSGVHMLDFMVLAQGVNASLNFGDIARARAYLARMAEVAQGRNGRAYYQYLASWEAFLSDDEPRALARAEEALRLAVDSGMPFAEALAQLALAHLLHDRDSREEALQHLRAARLIADSTGSSYFDFACSLAEARFAGVAGERTRMLEALRRMLTVGARQGIGSIYWWVPEWITPLCGEALRAGIEPEYVRRLIRQWQLLPEAPPYDCERWPWEIRVHTLGRFDVERDGQLLVYATKAPRRILTLLRILVAHGPRGATEECLADLLWPRAEGDAARQALATSLHRLRRLLGSERAVAMRDGRVTLDARRCWVDAHAFEALLRRPSGSRGAGPAPEASTVEAAQRIEAALALYRGPFLADSEEPWAAAGRERLRAQLVRAVAEQAAAQERAGRPDAALALYLRHVEADDGARPLAAEAVRRLRAAGRGHEAAALARRAGVSDDDVSAGPQAFEA